MSETNENLATCSLFGGIQYCKGDSTSAIFVDRLTIDVLYKKPNFMKKNWVIISVHVISLSFFLYLHKS